MNTAILVTLLATISCVCCLPREKRQLVLCPINEELRKCETPEMNIGCDSACPSIEAPKCQPNYCLNAKGTRFNGLCLCKQGFVRGEFNVCIALETCPAPKQ